MSRYMTQDAKREELRAWELAKAAHGDGSHIKSFVGGHGYPDPEIYGYVDRLNHLSRLATLQSCAGHRCTPLLHCAWCAENTDIAERSDSAGVEASDHVMPGQLWLWPDEKLGRWFLHYAPELAALNGIEKVSVLWHVEGREIIDIVFEGAGHGKLSPSVGGIICPFFERGNRECNLW